MKTVIVALFNNLNTTSQAQAQRCKTKHLYPYKNMHTKINTYVCVFAGVLVHVCTDIHTSTHTHTHMHAADIN